MRSVPLAPHGILSLGMTSDAECLAFHMGLSESGQVYEDGVWTNPESISV